MAINCYACDATDTSMPFQCSEWFERYDTPDIQPSNCSDVHDARYCIKHVGRFEGILKPSTLWLLEWGFKN